VATNLANWQTTRPDQLGHRAGRTGYNAATLCTPIWFAASSNEKGVPACKAGTPWLMSEDGEEQTY
jgi:hypothetical protein